MEALVGPRMTKIASAWTGERERWQWRREGTSKHSNYFSKETSADGALLFKANMAEWSAHQPVVTFTHGSAVLFFSLPALFSLRPIPFPRSLLFLVSARPTIFGKKSPVAFSQKSPERPSSSLVVSPFLHSQPGARAERRSAFCSLIQIRDLVVSRTNLWIPNIAGATQTCRHWNSWSDSKRQWRRSDRIGDWC